MRGSLGPSDVRSLARECTREAVRKLATLMRHAESESVQMGCAALLLERGWGKAPQAITGENGEGDIRVVVRHIVRGEIIDQPMKTVSQVAHEPNGPSSEGE